MFGDHVLGCRCGECMPCTCGRRIEAKWFQQHLRHCDSGPTESDAERDDTQQKRMEREGDFLPPALTAYEKRIARENARRFGDVRGPTKKEG